MKKWLWTLAITMLATLASATQAPLFSPTVSPVSGLQLTNNYNSAIDSINTCNSGATAPTNQLSGVPSPGNCWLDTSLTPYKWKIYDGTQWTTVAFLDQTNHYWTPVVGGGPVNSIASAATTDLCNATNGQPAYVSITGVVSITSFGSNCTTGQIKFITFTGVLTFTHNAASLILPNNGSNITTAAGDVAVAIYLGGGNWRVAPYMRASGQALVSASSVVRTTKTANYSPNAGDQGTWIDGTTGTWTLSPVNPATLGNGWWIYWSNSGTGNITITPAAGTIDGLSTFVSYPGEARIIQSDGVNLNSIVLSPYTLVITATGATTFTVPPKYSGSGVLICGAGGGGGGGVRSAGATLGAGGGGGGGGYCFQQTFKSGDLGTSQTVTIGTGGTSGAGATVNNTAGTNGGVGGSSTFGTLLTAFGGGGGSSSTSGGAGGSGGGSMTAGVTASGGTGASAELNLPSSGNSAQCSGGNAVAAPNTGAAVSPCPGFPAGGAAASSNGSSVGGTGPSTLLFGPGGAGGGGHAATNVGQAGGVGGKSSGCSTGPSGGAAGTNNGTSTAADFNYRQGCGGGGGGGANGTPNSGGNGGAGTNAGGGGGGGSGNASNAGNGGAGGNGFAYIRGNI